MPVTPERIAIAMALTDLATSDPSAAKAILTELTRLKGENERLREGEGTIPAKLGNTPTDQVLSIAADMLDEFAERDRLADAPVVARKLRDLRSALLSALAEGRPMSDEIERLVANLRSRANAAHGKAPLSETAQLCLEAADALTATKAKLAEASEENSRWILRISAIREASGVGAKPMLSELPEAIAAIVRDRDQARAERDEERALAAERLEALKPYARDGARIHRDWKCDTFSGFNFGPADLRRAAALVQEAAQ